ncbi:MULTISPECIES: hypothetical protein [Streptomyces]|uniref:hypothetical protein n=1 Tax=Streptomyces TaxID=1883 RepID=UPI001489B396|nr:MULTISPECIES: hypothetical protein [Streptomyces]
MPHEAAEANVADVAEADVADVAEAGPHGRILRVLDRLLYDAQFRSAFIADGPGGMRPPLDADLIEVFDRVDLTELRLVGRNIRSAVVSGGTGTGQGLKGAFARTLETIRERHGLGVNAVAELFLASAQFQYFRDVPYSPQGRGLTLPECFHRFMAAGPSFDPEGTLEPLVHYEAACAIARAIATGAGATFDVTLRGAAFHGGVFCAFRDYAEAPAAWELHPTMFLAGAGRCVIGPAGRPLFDALTSVLAGHDVGMAPDVRAKLQQRLRSWGLG